MGRTLTLLLVASTALVGCSFGARAVAPTVAPTALTVAAPSTPKPAQPVPSPTPIPPPNAIGRVTPPPSPTLPPGATTRISLALSGPPSAAQIGLFVARERGYFLQGGLDVFFHATGSAPAALAALGSGRDDLALVAADDVLLARAQGTPVISVMALDARGSDGYGLVLATTDAMRARAPDPLKAFAVAVVRGYADTGRDPGIAVDALSRASSLVDRDAAGRAVGELVPFWRAAGPLGLQSEARWRDAQSRLVGRGQAIASLDPSTAFTNELALAAVPTATATSIPTATQRPTATRTPRPTLPPPPIKPALPTASPAPATPGQPIDPAPTATPAGQPSAPPPSGGAQTPGLVAAATPTPPPQAQPAQTPRPATP